MSDENRNESGQFAPAPEILFGQEAIERDAGYVPYKEETAAEAEPELTIAEAVEQTVAERAPESQIKTYSPIDELPDNVTLTIDQASKLLTAEHAAQAKEAQDAEDDALRAQIDELRGVKPETKQAEAVEQVAAEPSAPGELDQEIEKALANPKIQAALSQHVAEVETARQEHMRAVDGAAHIAIAAFLGQFPEFAHIPQENMGGAIQAMQQQDPARAAQVAAHVQKTLHIFDQQKLMHQQEAQQKQTRFQEYAKTEDARFSDLVKGETKQTMDAVPSLIQEALVEYGVDPAEFGRLGMQSEFLRSAAAQRLLVDAAKYRQMMKATRPVPAREPLPPVQRPGAAQPRLSHESASISKLNANFDRDPSVKNAALLYRAEKAAKERRA